MTITLDATLAHEIKGFGRIGDSVTIHDLQSGMFALPGAVAWAFRAAIASTVRVINRERGFRDPFQRAPTLERHFRLHLGRGLGELAARIIFVKVHRAAGAMED